MEGTGIRLMLVRQRRILGSIGLKLIVLGLMLGNMGLQLVRQRVELTKLRINLGYLGFHSAAKRS